MKYRFKLLLPIFVSLLMMGCASTPQLQTRTDKVEGVNRAIYKFNQFSDDVLIKPAISVYDYTLPSFVKTGFSNFFGVFGDCSTFVNSLLQAKPSKAANSAGRLVANVLFGGLGLVDTASYIGIPKEKETVAQTLAYYGVPSGTYIVLPLFGPSSVRDMFSLVGETQITPYFDLTSGDIPLRNIGMGIDYVQTRNKYQKGYEIMKESSLDPYLALREAYFGRMDYDIYDGNPPIVEDEY